MEVRQREEAHERNAQRDADRRADLARRDDARRVSEAERARRIDLQRQREAEYRRYIDARNAAEAQRIAALRNERRAQQYAYQQWYWRQQQAMQARWTPRDAYNDPYYSAPVRYRYVRDGRYYNADRYAADMLQQAVRYGYDMGARAGNADRVDGWRSDWRNNFAYQDASYGYNGNYVDQDEYNYYFRQGFQRGYDDAYGQDYRYGTYNGNGAYGNGNDTVATILASVLQSILGLQQY